jgi:nucleotide-binding universal stress UspA family protein
MPTHLLVATDLSPIADLALDRAIAIAARTPGAVRLTLALAHPGYAASPAMGPMESAAVAAWAAAAATLRADGERALAARLARATAAGVPAALVTRDGAPDDVIPALATELGCDLVVVGTHGRTGIRRFALGSVAEHVVRRSPVSVLVSRGSTGGEHHRILVATDFSPAADQAAREALAVAAADAHVELAHAWTYPPGAFGLDALAGRTAALDALRAALTAGAEERGQALAAELAASPEARGRTVTFRLLEGPTASALTHHAETHHHDLVALGTHGYRGFRRLLLGSVAEATVRHAPCSVLVAHAASASPTTPET